MAITFTSRGSNKGTSTSVSVTPSATPSFPLLLLIACKSGNLPSTVSGGGAASWELKSSTEPGANSIYVYEAQGGTLDTSNVTVTWPSNIVTHLHLVEPTGARTTGTCMTNGRESERMISGTNGTSVDALLPDLAHTSNGWVAILMVGGESGTGIAADADTTELSEQVTAAQLSSQVCSVVGNNLSDQKINWSWSGSFSNSFAVFEIVEATNNEDGAAVRREQRKAVADTDNTFSSGTFTTDGGNSVIVMGLLMEDDTLEDPSSVSDAVGSYSKCGSAVDFDSTHRLTVWARRETTGGTRTITATFADATLGSLGWIIELFGTAGGGNTDWFGDVDTNTGAAVTSIATPALTLGADSGVLAFIGKDTNASDITPDDGWAPASQQGSVGASGPRLGANTADPLATINCIWRANPGDTTPGASFASSDAGIIGFEVLSATTSSAATNPGWQLRGGWY